MSSYISKELSPELIWSSTLLRATQSTEILNNAVKCPVEYLTELCEMQNRESKLDFRLRAENILAAVRERETVQTNCNCFPWRSDYKNYR